MWDSIPLAKQEEWKTFYELEPDLVERIDWNFAHVVQALMRSGKHLKEFVLPFGDRPTIQIVQSIATQEMLIDAWIFGSNAMHAKKQQR